MPRKKDVTESMIDIFSDFQDNKKIGRTTLVGVLEESFRSVLAKMFGSDENFDVIVNPDKGDLEIYRNRIVVGNDDVNDPAASSPILSLPTALMWTTASRSISPLS